MERKPPQSLAEYLGVSSSENPNPDPFPFESISPKKFCKAILGSPEFRTYILHGLTLGTLPPQILTRIIDVAGWPKTADKLEVKDTSTPLESRSVEELESRASHLLELAKRVRAANQLFDATNNHKLM